MTQDSVPVRWIDCTLFNGEAITLLRLQYLWNVVDVFYICEARYTYQGQRKETLYIEQQKELFEPYMSKVKFITFEEPFTALMNYEHRHRNYPAEVILAQETGPYIVFCADVDEFPDIRTLPSKGDLYAISQRDGPIHLEQRMYYYNFNWRMVGPWTGPYFLSDTRLATIRTFNPLRYFNPATSKHRIPCGWHFSYFQSIAEIRRKLASFSHAEYNTPRYTEEAHILDCITNGKDLFFRNKTFEREDLSHFPPEFLEFGRKWLPAF
jgi:hypothetical protein